MPAAAIDLGSNSALLTVVDDQGMVLHDEARVVGLGQGLGDRGLFRPDRMEAAELALRDYVSVAAKLGVPAHSIRAVATSSARRAMNATTFFSKVQRAVGLRIQVISGEEEARLTFLGCQRDLTLPAGPILAVDLGGGSTELAVGEGPELHKRVSLELGSVRLTEAFLPPRGPQGTVDPSGLARARRHIEQEFARAAGLGQARTVVGVAGSVTSLAAAKLGLRTYDPQQIHGSRLTRSDLARFIDALLPATAHERRQIIAVSPKRADYLLAGCLVLDAALSLARRQQMVVSDRGLRFALVAAGR